MLLTRERAQELFQQVIKYSTADETEVLIASNRYALTRFANNAIHQHVTEDGVYLSVRAVTDKRMARAGSNKLDETSIRRLTESALELAKLQPRDAELLPMPGPQMYRSVSRFYPDTAALCPQDRARGVAAVIRRAEADQLMAAGVFSSGSSVTAIFNSRGLQAFHEETLSELSVTTLGPTSSGWAKKTGANHNELDPEALADRAARKALAGADPKEIPPGRYTVILEPAAVLDLFGFLVFDFSGLAVAEQRSSLTGRVGQKLFGSNVELRDDIYHPLHLGAPFDGEGMPRQRVTLVEGGVVRNLVYARQTAARLGVEPTGHGCPLPNEQGEAPMSIVMEGGHHSLEDMICSTERGLLVTRLWYIREVDPYQKIVTGMTRDGTFWIEGGALKYGVKNLRFNQSLIEMLSKVEMLGPAERAAGEESFEMVVPAMKVPDFNFSSVTKF